MKADIVAALVMVALFSMGICTRYPIVTVAAGAALIVLGVACLIAGR